MSQEGRTDLVDLEEQYVLRLEFVHNLAESLTVAAQAAIDDTSYDPRTQLRAYVHNLTEAVYRATIARIEWDESQN